MQRHVEMDRPSSAVRELVLIFSLVFLTWYLAELSVRIFDTWSIASLVPALLLVAFAYRLWHSLQQERNLRRQAEERLQANDSRAAIDRGYVGLAAGVSAPQALLTDREIEVLTLIASSCTNQRIAETLSISLNTVERHIANVYRKLSVRGRVEATHYAVRCGLVTEDTVRRCREQGPPEAG